MFLSNNGIQCGMWKKKRENRYSTIDNHFCGRRAVDKSGFHVLFNNYLNEWMNVNYDVMQRMQDGQHVNPHRLYSEYIGVDESIIKSLCESGATYIPSAILNDMNLGICEAEVETVTIEKKMAIVRLVGRD